VYIAIDTFHPIVGGAEAQALIEAAGLRRRGFEATIVTLRHEKAWPRHETMDGAPIIRVAGWVAGDRHKLPAPLRKLAFVLGLLVFGWTLWLRRARYDVLHVYQLNLLALPLMLVCWVARKPLILAIRSSGSGEGGRATGPTRLVAGPLDAGASWLLVDERVRNDGDLDVLATMGAPVVAAARWLLRRARATVVVLSPRMRAEVFERGFARASTVYIPNGVDTERFAPAERPAVDDEPAPLVVCVARLTYQKGGDVLLQAWREVREQLPGARLVLVGPGPLLPQLERMASALGIAESVDFAGAREDVVAYWRRATLAVLPSRWEGMPNALLEAMACGLPCVATRVSGSEDVIRDGVNGVLVEPEDCHGLATALVALLRDPARARAYGRAARATITESYALDRILDQYVELCRKVVGAAAGLPE
jgi:glycosyltransferase involved in cell wall biosynthesis